MKTVKQMLNEYGYQPETIKTLNNELNQLIQYQEVTEDNVRAQVITGMPQQKTEAGDPTYQAVAKVIDTYQKRIEMLTAQINEQIENKEIIDKAVVCLTMEELRIIDYRYFKQYKMKRIPFSVHFSLAHCYRLHDSAIKKLSEKIESMRKNEKLLVV